MRRVPIRMKLAGALVIPLLALVVVTALEVLDSLDQVHDVHAQADLATAAIGPVSLLSRIEDERNAAAVYLLNLGDAVALPVEDNAEARDNTDGSLTALREDVEERGGAVAAAYAKPLAAMRGLEDIRKDIDASTAPRNTENMEFASNTFDRYSELMNEMFAANQQVTVAIKDSDLRRGAELIDLEAHQTDLLARLVRDDLVAALTGDQQVNSSEELSVIARQLGQLRLNENLIRTKAEHEYRPLADALFKNDPVILFPRLVDQVLETGNPNIADVAGAASGDDPDTFGYTVFRFAVDSQLQSDADAIERQADAHLVRYLALAGVAMFAALLVTWLVSRSITRPLRALTQQAKVMSTERLPSVVLEILETPLGDDVEVPTTRPVEVKTRDEVGDVAKALNTVQDAAVELAVEQAVLRRNIADSFVNLGRRNQNLLGRQLDFITELESNETDPDTLASLFRLDHLATRMRRNAESLLVLAGIEPPRKWAAPVRLADVIRAALGEVEDYQRVTIRNIEPATIIGSAAADLAHLIAEFVENALTFSPPDQSVEIRGRGRADGYTLAVIDNGFGMPPNDIEQANRRLAGAESFTIAPSKYLGHYVAGNLAARHGIHLRLDPSAGTGVTATIDLPASLLTADAAVPDGTPSHPRQASAAAALANAGGMGRPDGLGGLRAPGAPGGNGGNGRTPGRGDRDGLAGVGGGNGAGSLPSQSGQPHSGSTPAIDVPSWAAGNGNAAGRGAPDHTAPMPSTLPTSPAAPGRPNGPMPGPSGPGGDRSGAVPLAPAASAGGQAWPGGPATPGGPAVPGGRAMPGAPGDPMSPAPGRTDVPGMPGSGTSFPGIPGSGGRATGMPGSGTGTPGIPGSGTGTGTPGMPGSGTAIPGMPGSGTPGLPGSGTAIPGMPGSGTGTPRMPASGAGGPAQGGAGGGAGRPGMPTPGDWFYASARGRAGQQATRPAAAAAAGPSAVPLDVPGAIGQRLPGAPAAPARPGLTGLAGLPGVKDLQSRPGAGGPAESSRTASGLTKRTRRPGESRPAATVPSQEVLASLARHNANLQTSDRGTMLPAPGPDGGSPSRPPLVARQPSSPAPTTQTPAGLGIPGGGASGVPAGAGAWPASDGPFPSTGTFPPGGPFPPASPGPGAGPGGAFGPGTGSGLGTGGAWVPPQPAGPTLGRAGARPPQGGPVPPGGPIPPTGAGAPPPAAAGSTTPGGLARRVRGAQLPTSKVAINLRRASSEAPAAPEQPSAGDVYGFLTSFTEGVQRGLDDSRGEGEPPA